MAAQGQSTERSEPGEVVAIHLAAVAAGPMSSFNEAQAVAGRGLAGDRYFVGAGTYSGVPEPGRQVTLIEAEAIEAAAIEACVDFQSSDSRRNVVTRGISLNDLVGREFRVGTATLRGVDFCEPCSHMIQISGKPVLRSLVHRGGLRADVVSGGTIRVGDAVHENRSAS
ncbi:MAG: hypothetical protein HW416_1052 [Chloroflexi bacterium]|nr:hypothetical protein [Chloroflexota bacterium]